MKQFFKFIGYSIVRLLLLLWQLPQTLLGIIYLLIFGFIIPKLIIKPYNKLRYLKYKNNIKKGINYHNYDMGFQSKTKLRKITPYFIIGTKVDWFAKFFIKFKFLESIPMSKCGYSLVFGSIIINKDFYNNLQMSHDEFGREFDTRRAIGCKILSAFLGPLYLPVLFYKIFRNIYYFEILSTQYEYKGHGHKKLIKKYRNNRLEKLIEKLGGIN